MDEEMEVFVDDNVEDCELEAVSGENEEVQTEEPAGGSSGEVAAVSEDADGRRKMFSDFFNAYPDTEVKDIPPEVMKTAVVSGDLKGAFDAHLIRELRRENDELRRSITNSSRSTGSRASAGKGKSMSAFDALWYDGN